MIPTKYPIVCASMNQVSDVRLAVAVSRAGCLPSLFINNYMFDEPGKQDVVSNRKFYDALTEFRRTTNTSKIIVSTSAYLLKRRPDIVETIIKHRVYAVELVQYAVFDSNIISQLKLNGVKFFAKTSSSQFILDHKNIFDIADGVILKGPDSAGRIEDTGIPFEEEIKTVRSIYPDKMLIASGGVKDSSDVRLYLELGADMVSVGTLFALSHESAISPETKNAMLANASSVGILEGSTQNAIVFKKLDSDDDNNTNGLKQGIQSPSSGHVFAGKGIMSVSAVRHVHEIVADLISGL